MPRSQHSLIVRGQSSKSPHTSNMTSLAPGKGISGFAYQTSQIANVSELMDGDSRIAYHEQEANVQSALAIPIGVNGSVNGVIYMAARTSHAFDRTDEQVLGIFAQLIGQLIENSQVGRMVQNHITQFMTRPKILDPLFTSFESHDAFLEDLASCIVKIRDHENGIITIMAVDMDNSTAIGELYGDNAVRQTWLGLGEKLRKYLQSSQLSQRTTNIYRTLHDRYVLILPFVSPNASVEFARQLKKTIESDPVPIYISGGEALPYPIRVKLGIVSTPATLLTEMTGSTRDIVQLLTRQLNGALRRAKEQGGSRICVWDSNKSDYNFCD